MIACGASLLASVACGASPADAPKEPALEAPIAEAAPTPTAPPAIEPSAPTAQQMPIAEDFEAEAEAAIDARNYKRDLAAMGREITRDAAKARHIK